MPFDDPWRSRGRIATDTMNYILGDFDQPTPVPWHGDEGEPELYQQARAPAAGTPLPNTIPDIPVTATVRPEGIGPPIESTAVTAVASPELRRKDQYFDQLYGPMTELARKINVPVELLLGHGVAEGGWGVVAPDSNNSVFGFSQKENAIRFPSPQASIDAFGNGYWGKALAGKQNLDDYLTELHRVPGHDFNSKREDYDPWVRGRVNDVRAVLPGWKARRGIE